MNQKFDCDIIVNIQGDEPFINKNDLKKIIEVFNNDIDNKIDIVSLMISLKSTNDIVNPNNVKVIVDNNNFALYFSRSKIPFNRDEDHNINYFRHIGVYGFRKKSLIDFFENGETPLESSEKIECIRHLEMGKKIKMVRTDMSSLSIDEYSDLLKANKLLN